MVARSRAAVLAGIAPPPVRTELIRSATWRAARSGLTGALVDPVEQRLAPAADVVARLLTELREPLEATGDWDTVSELASRAIRTKGAAERQRRAFRQRDELTDVVDLLITETAGR
jgi:carboxylate-amine ligase